jgi:hypothetical protein
MALRLTLPLKYLSTWILGEQARPAREADILTSIFEQFVQKT